MQITIKGTANTDTIEAGEVRTVELTPFIRGLLRNGLAVQVARLLPDPAEVKPAPAKKAPAKKTAAKKAAKPVDEFDNGGIGSGILRVPDSLPVPERVLSTDDAEAFVKAADALTDEE